MTKEQEAEEIRREIWRLEEQKDKKKFKTLVWTWIVVAIVIYVLWHIRGDMNSTKEYLLGLISSPVASGIYLYINALVFTPLLNAGHSEDILIERYRMEVRRLEKGQE